MKVSSDALNTKEKNDEHAGNDTGRSKEGESETGAGDETIGGEEGREGSKGERHPIRKQGRESFGIDEA